ncbi:S53 family peptidase [Streptomyces monashensis]|uniref:S53 family peptidase n=1 Tax=Streptomyces monashensis TaxID=1678012 RepID=UPI0009A121B6|nr:S53 family peptidase [Streptomyces monashensis]
MFTRIHKAAAVVSAVLVVTASASAAHAAGPSTRHVLAGSHPAYAAPASDQGPIPGDATLTARLYLGYRNPDQLSTFIRTVTDPQSPRYQNFISPEEFEREYGLTANQRRNIARWLTGAGLKITADTSHYVQVSGPEQAMKSALGTSIHRYQTSWGPMQAPAADVSLPQSVGDAVVALTGIGEPPAAMPLGHPAPAPVEKATCSDYFGQHTADGLPPAYGKPVSYAPCPYVPRQLRDAYGVSASGATGRGRTVAIVGAYGSPTMASDADRYAKVTGDHAFRQGQYREHVTPAHWKVTPACAPPSQWAGEQALDVEMAHGYAPDANVLYVGANSCLDSDLMDAEAYVLDHHSADVISNSWAEIIHSQRAHLTPGLVSAWNMLFEQAAAEGIGVYFAAGDCGDSSPQAAGTGLNCDKNTTQAQADFPSGSPWVTSVGGTTLALTRKGGYGWETSMGDDLSILSGNPKTAWTPLPGVFAFGGGGGPSDFPQPWYQRGVVTESLANGRRVTPDVAVEGDGAVPVAVGYTTGGAFHVIGYGGTSAACPAFAAIQADAEQKSGRSIGFANPLLYSLHGTGVFHDVTDRPSPAQGRPVSVVRDMGPTAHPYRYILYTLGRDYGLRATSGFDDATGLGTPNINYLRYFQRGGTRPQ